MMWIFDRRVAELRKKYHIIVGVSHDTSAGYREYPQANPWENLRATSTDAIRTRFPRVGGEYK